MLYTQLAALVGEFQEEDFDDTQTAFDHIAGLSTCFQKLAAFVKSNDKKEVLAVTLRHSKVFMEQFIKRVLPFLGIHFRGHQDAVARIFKNNLQAATRSLQVCLETTDFGSYIATVFLILLDVYFPVHLSLRTFADMPRRRGRNLLWLWCRQSKRQWRVLFSRSN